MTETSPVIQYQDDEITEMSGVQVIIHKARRIIIHEQSLRDTDHDNPHA